MTSWSGLADAGDWREGSELRPTYSLQNDLSNLFGARTEHSIVNALQAILPATSCCHGFGKA
jgi:hypothetical protein